MPDRLTVLWLVRSWSVVGLDVVFRLDVRSVFHLAVWLSVSFFLDYKGNSYPAKTIDIESVESNTNTKQAWARDTSEISTDLTDNNTTRNHVNYADETNDSTTSHQASSADETNDNTIRNYASSADETDEHPYKDAIFRIGKV